MTRDIKFRAWDKENKIMIYDNSQDISELYNLLPGDFIPNTVRKIGKAYKTYMQYTGLKDKNGKEIYDGDIIQCSDNFTGEVWWYNDEAQWCVGNHRLWEIDEPKVIGNIYEYNELLNLIK